MNQVHLILYDKHNLEFHSCVGGLVDGTVLKTHQEFARELGLEEPLGRATAFIAVVDPSSGDATVQSPYVLTSDEETAVGDLFVGSVTIQYAVTTIPLDEHTTTTTTSTSSTTTTTASTTTTTTATTTSTTTT